MKSDHQDRMTSSNVDAVKLAMMADRIAALWRDGDEYRAAITTVEAFGDDRDAVDFIVDVVRRNSGAVSSAAFLDSVLEVAARRRAPIGEPPNSSEVILTLVVWILVVGGVMGAIVLFVNFVFR